MTRNRGGQRERESTLPMNFCRFLVLLAKVYIRMRGMVTYTPNLAISKIPLDAPRDDIFPRKSLFHLKTHQTGRSLENGQDIRAYS